MAMPQSRAPRAGEDRGIDSSYAWIRLAAALGIGATGGIGLWSSVILLPETVAYFGVERGDASLPFTATMMGIMLGGVVVGRLVDRFGAVAPVLMAATCLGIGYVGVAFATELWQVVLLQGVLIGGLGTAATFGPLIASTSLWFARHRGIAIALVASGNYVAGTIWPPIIRLLIDNTGWRDTHLFIGAACFLLMVPLALMLRRRPPDQPVEGVAAVHGGRRPPPLPGNQLQTLLVVAGIACCVAMAMPQVHIVAYCVDLDIAAARGAEMLSLMLGLGVVSRILFGLVADRIGALWILFIGSSLQAVCLLLYLPAGGIVSLYVVSGLFGLFQGGIVPAYAMIVRDYFPASQAGFRVGLVLAGTIAGMAIGGWFSGAIYDVTLSYEVAFLNGFAWNLLNMAIVVFLLWCDRGPGLATRRRPPSMLEAPLVGRWPGALR